MYVKLHKGSSCVLAICDEDLIGKTFEEGELFLEISEDFYKGEKKTKEEVLEMLRDENIKNFNIVGKESISVALKAGIIEKQNILTVGGVPHAQSLLL